MAPIDTGAAPAMPAAIAEQHSPIEILRAHRAAVTGRIARLAAERDRLRSAEDTEREAVAALAGLGQQEIDAARTWASGSAPGSAPVVDAAKRAELTANLVTAQAGAEAGRGAGADVDQELADASREAVDLAGQIEMAAVADIVARFGGEWSDVQIRAVELRATIARALAVLQFLRDRADEHRTRGREAEAMAIFRQVEPLYSGLSLDFNPTNGEVHGFSAAWEQHFRDLIR